ncbi:77407ddc-1ca0-4b29-9aff-5cfbe6b284e4 [Sclerotinia trifoliorum]|uniref:77407ddc-1ca0-4b29-9aff-5cfbe6b284e4 n=1 Tax=Sclerotinia trifoliorum TaxID=28548 RepID=A0A8H2ZTV0_9HELO|nr:77407ddc-1ca0-4b29-9aff-5cfbe6b284e4 [Sclerotinia trifoliorum]
MNIPATSHDLIQRHVVGPLILICKYDSRLRESHNSTVPFQEFLTSQISIHTVISTSKSSHEFIPT